ncbi:MAG: LysR family transcriptional regulator [Streptosporangiales bacterium]|nr:LysR family transcriptional regulator [Streptosporangiales bacterium]
MMDVRRMRLLLELSRRGTVTAAAEALGYTPSAVSQQLAVLEREAGAELLERAGRRVTLTAAGTVLAGYAESVLATLEEASSAVAATRAALTGRLRIGAFPSAARTLLPPSLVALGRDHPGLELALTELDAAAVPDALASGALDVAVTFSYDCLPDDADPALETEPLLEETVYLTVPDLDRGDGTIAGCRGSAWIAGTPGTSCHDMLVRACGASGFTPRIRHYADDFGTVLALVAAGQGVSLIPELGVVHRPTGVTLIPLAARRRIRVACRRGNGRHPAVAACTAAIRKETDSDGKVTATRSG